MERTLPRRVVLARRHRSLPTRAEVLLWQWLRRRQIDGFQFRHQFPIGPYFADFICVQARLAIEVGLFERLPSQAGIRFATGKCLPPTSR